VQRSERRGSGSSQATGAEYVQSLPAAWLKRCGIRSVALESTGIYWISLYEVLEQYGFEIRVVNARHVKHVPERTKTDVLDCQWIQKLHSFGLLNGSLNVIV
jgi:transposase